jgi:hypothetical protein
MRNRKDHKLTGNTERPNQNQSIDSIEEMWDRQLAKGDDDFYDAFKGHRAIAKNANEVNNEKPVRRHRRSKGL